MRQNTSHDPSSLGKEGRLAVAVIRNERKAHFTIVPNEGLRSDTLSLQAKGLLALMLSFPDDWQYNLTHLEQLSVNGRDAHRNALKELIDAGYAIWRTVHNPDGTLKGRELVVSDAPTLNRAPEKPSDGTTVGLETPTTVSLENRPSGKPSVGKPEATNTDLYEEPLNEDSSSSSSTKTTDPETPGEEEEATRSETPLDLTARGKAAMALGPHLGHTDNHLPTFHPDTFKRLVTLRRLHGKKATDEMFRTWSHQLYRDIDQHGQTLVNEALDTTIFNFPNLNYPWSFYRACLKQSPTPQAPDNTPTLDSTHIDQLVATAKEGKL